MEDVISLTITWLWSIKSFSVFSLIVLVLIVINGIMLTKINAITETIIFHFIDFLILPSSLYIKLNACQYYYPFSRSFILLYSTIVRMLIFYKLFDNIFLHYQNHIQFESSSCSIHSIVKFLYFFHLIG